MWVESQEDPEKSGSFFELVKEKIELILNEILSETSLFALEVIVHKNRIEIYLDGDQGVNLEECTRVNRVVHLKLEEEGIDTGEFVIEVSSAGLERPLNALREYKKNVGRVLQMRNMRNQLLKGRLVYVDTEKILLEAGGGKRGEGRKKIETFSYSQIKEAKVEIE